MKQFAPPNVAAIGQTLRNCGENVVQTAPARWSLQLRNGKVMRTWVVLVDEWLSLAANLRLGPTRELPWRLLTLNAQLARAARFTLDPETRSIRIRVDVHCHNDTALAARVMDACAALHEAGCAVERYTADDDVCLPAHAVRSDSDTCANRWRELLAESEWQYREHTVRGGELSVDLDARGGHYHASIDDRDNTFRCGLAVGQPASIRPLCREALGVLLLTATDTLRLVRAAAESTEAGDAVRLEVALPSAPTVADIDEALGALASACEHLAREAHALADHALAAAYLELRCGRHGEELRESGSERSDVSQTTIQGG